MKWIVTVFIFLLKLNSIIACDCWGEKYFCETINDPNSRTEYIIKGVKLADTIHGMDVEIIHSYLNSIAKDTIRVWGDNGFLCRVYTSRFEVGDTLILNLHRIDSTGPTGNNLGEKGGEYILSVCGVFYLEVENGKIMGSVSPSVDSLTVAEFDEYMLNEGYLNNCLTVSTKSLVIDIATEIFPNPTIGLLSIISVESMSEVTIFDGLGKAIFKSPAIREEQLEIDLSNFPAGVYFVIINYSNEGYRYYKVFKE